MSLLQAQILGNRFAALAAEGAERFAAMSRSPLVIEEGQYACAILDADGRLIAQDQGEPSHLAAVQASVEYMLDAFAFNLSEGDVILTGDPYCGGTWGGVMTIALPVFFDGDLQFITAIRFAAADLAGNIPGPFQPDAHEVWQESLRLTPIKLLKAGAPQKDVRQYVLRNTRATDLLESDLTTATVTVKRLGAHIEDMVTTKGLALVQQAAQQRISYGATRARAAFSKVTPGTFQLADLSVDVRMEDRLHVDFTGSAPSRADSSNLTLQATRAAVLIQLAADVIEDAGMSQGILDALQLTVPEGSVINPDFPAAVSMGWRLTAPVLSMVLARAVGATPAIYPAAPLVMLFDEVGSTDVTQPVALSPGFCPCPGFAGSDAAAGRRRIISAEETEAAGLVVMEKRQSTPNGMEASVRVVREGLECIVVPGAARPRVKGADHLERSNVMSLPAGSSLHFDYPVQEGGSDAEL